MDNPVDNIIDLGLVNYVAHPENKNYVVFRFVDPKRAESFEKLLTKANIWFEKGEEDKKGKIYTLFGIGNRDFKTAQKFNILVESKHKQPFIPNVYLRYLVLLVGGIILTLTMIGYCEARKRLEEANKATEQSILEQVEWKSLVNSLS